MRNLWLIIRREYLTRVRRRAFILTTLLTPLAIAVFFLIVGLIFRYSGSETKRFAVIDTSEVLGGSLPDSESVFFKFTQVPLDSLRQNFDDYDYDGIIDIPAINNLYASRQTIYFYGPEQLSLDTEVIIRQKVRSAIRRHKIETLGLDEKELAALDFGVDVEPEPLIEGEDAGSRFTSVVGAMLGFGMGLFMYISVFVYGMMVMRSVMEEKTNRIVEVMVSTVRPFHLMLGKIIGVGGVGLTQFLIWAILVPVLVLLVNLFTGFEPPSADVPVDLDEADLQAMVALAMEEINRQPWMRIIPLFIIYFLGGYVLYASLFAAVGSAMSDDMGESQALTIPISIPVVLGFYIMMAVLQAPNSSLAVWSSMFPLFSPMVMPARLAFDPPAWQIILSVVILIGSVLFFTWLSAKIYRTGILLYGKKISLRELGRWMLR